MSETQRSFSRVLEQNVNAVNHIKMAEYATCTVKVDKLQIKIKWPTT